MLDYSRETTFQWNDAYMIAAADTPYVEGGCQFFFRPHFIDTDHQSDLTSVRTKPESISIRTEDTGDAFFLKDWATYGVGHKTPMAPKYGFAFENGVAIKDPGASAIVYLTSFTAAYETAAAAVPCELLQSLCYMQRTKSLLTETVYMSPFPCIGKADHKLVPVKQVIVFFIRGAKSGSMVSTNRAFEQVIDLTTEPKQSWLLGDDKKWVKV